MNDLNRFIKFGVELCVVLVLFSFSARSGVAAQNEGERLAAPLECGQFALKNLDYFKIPSTASTVLAADFNNDSIPDIAAPMPNTNSIAVALGDNQTGFQTSREFVAGVSPQDLVAGDFNRDGEIDLAVTSAADALVNILLGDGAGNFTLNASYAVGAAPREVQTGDFNNDGWLDLAVGNTGAAPGLSVLLGRAGGFTSASPATIPLNGKPESFKIADFNHDGKDDIVTAAQNSSGGDSSVVVLNGNGDGTFTTALTLTVGLIYMVETADFNNDGYADFAFFANPNLAVRVYLNNQNGGFNAPLEIPLSGTFGSIQSLYAGDLNDDGKVDLVTGRVILFNDGNANFTLRDNADTIGGNPALADFNGDGIVDQASPGALSDNAAPGYSTFAVSYGKGDAKFVIPTYLQGSGGLTQSVTGDFNNDGRLDIVMAAGTSFNQVQIAFQSPDGTFPVSPTAVYSNSGTSNLISLLVAADFNNDGHLDLATNVNWAHAIIVLINNGSGQFTPTSVGLNNPPFFIPLDYFQPGDFNNDGYPDFIAAGGNNYVTVLNNGAGGGFTVQPFVALNNSDGFKSIAVGDFNNDGKKDFALARGNALYYFRGNGDGTFVNANLYNLPSGASMVRSSDFNGDNRSDLIVTTGGTFSGINPGLAIFIADANGGFSQTNFSVSGAPNDILIGDFNGDSTKDFLIVNSPTNAVTLYAGNGSGGFTAQTPVTTLTGATAGAAADFNQDQKLDIVLGGRFAVGPNQIFYNTTPAAPCLSVGDVTVTESAGGASGAQFTVSLSAPAAQTVLVNYRVVGRSAAREADFGFVTGTLEFSPGTVTRTVNVPVTDDALDEIDETFQLVLSNNVNASLTDNIGVATITDDDAPPSAIIGDVSIVEGTAGNPTPMVFTVTLSSATGRKAKVGYTLLDGTAQGGSDFAAAAGTVVFNAGAAAQQFTVPVVADALVEPDENFRVKLAGASNLTIADDEATGTILNDDLGGTVQYQVAALEASENDDSLIVSVSRTGGAAAGIVVEYSTGDGTATANQDYLPSVGKMVFGAGETVKTFTIPILDDAVDEPAVETVNLTLANVTGGAVLGAQSTAVLNISDDDPPPTLALSGVSVSEGNNGGAATANFNVRLLAVSGQPVTVNFATADGTAHAAEDYQSSSGSLTFAPGETQKTVSVAINGDTDSEPDETFFLNLSAPVNVVLQNTQAVATIVNDDLGARRAPYDFDGDGKTDVGIFRPSDGSWWYLRSLDSQFRVYAFGTGTDIITPGDFTGDNKADIAVFRPETGFWFIQRSEDNSFFSFPFGTTGDVPAPADYDGDGKTDAAVFRPSSATWFILNSNGSGTSIVQFGSSEDKAVPADYDGDGKADIAIFRPSDGSWWYLQSSNAQFKVYRFGVGTDKPVQGDYTGDGKADIAIFRPSTGEWFFQRSEDNSYYSVPFGAAGDIPAPGDYDGDGKFDTAVFRPASADWFVQRSTAGILITNFGATGDRPVPGALVP
jgi:hypothetical protein